MFRKDPIEDHPLDARREPSALGGAGSSRSFAAIRKEVGRFCGSFLRNGEVFAYVGLSQNLKYLKDLKDLKDRILHTSS